MEALPLKAVCCCGTTPYSDNDFQRHREKEHPHHPEPQDHGVFPRRSVDTPYRAPFPSTTQNAHEVHERESRRVLPHGGTNQDAERVSGLFVTSNVSERGTNYEGLNTSQTFLEHQTAAKWAWTLFLPFIATPGDEHTPFGDCKACIAATRIAQKKRSAIRAARWKTWPEDVAGRRSRNRKR